MLKIVNVIIIISLLCTATSPYSKELEKVSLQLQWFDQFQFAGYYVAKEKGFYKDVGLDVDIKSYTWGTNVVDKVVSNISQYGIGRTSLIVDKSNGKDIYLLAAILQTSPLALISKKSSGIKELKDFIHKKVYFTSLEKEASILAMFMSEGIDESNLKVTLGRGVVEDLISGETDGLSIYTTNETYLLKQKGVEVNVFAPKDFGFDFYQDILFTNKNELTNHRQRVKKFTKASLKGWNYAFSHIEEVVNLIYEKYNSQNKSKDALLYEANALKKLAYYDLGEEQLGHIERNKIQRIIDIYQLLGLLKNKIYFNDFFFDCFDDTKFELSKEEKDWIKDNPVVTYSEINWRPLSIIEKDKMKGIMGDYLDLVAKQTGIIFKYVPSNSWPDVIKKFKEKKIDLIPGISTEEGHKLGLISKVYKSYPMVIVTKKKYKFIDNLDDLENVTIAIPDKYTSHKFITKTHPNIKLITTKDIPEALMLVGSGKADAFVGHIATSLYYISKFNLSNLKISGRTRFEFQHSFLLQKDHSLLASIVNKVFASITEQQKIKIDSAWMDTIEEQKPDYSLVWTLSLLFLLVLSIIGGFIIRLNKLKKNIEIEKNSFQNIFDRAKDSALIIRDGVIRECNHSTIEMFGYGSKEELLKLTPAQLSPQYQPDGNSSIKKSLKMIEIAIKNGYYHFKWLHEKADKTTFWCDIMLTYLGLHDDEKVLHVVIRDISIEKELEKEILEINTNLEQRIKTEVEKNERQYQLILHQSRMAQMGEILSMIAHQWRQPLNAISLTTSNLQIKVMLDEVSNQFFTQELSLIDSYSQHLSKTIDDFRSFFRDNKIKVVTTLEVIVMDSISITKVSIENKNIKIMTDFNCDAAIDTYFNELKQVVLIIIKNAEDVLLDRQVKNPVITIQTLCNEDKKHAQLIIKDNGGGVPEDIIDKIFDPYFSTKLEKNGTGLGLYMSKIIIEEHCAGRLTVSNDGDGAAFKIEFDVKRRKDNKRSSR